ncbi:MAG: hypothetical protein HY644_05265 [Acidobacteria bacterium]|nr:hypothetical protein [Acidobacteriota bacterium]
MTPRCEDVAHSFRIEYDAVLVEEAVLLCIADHADEARFRAARNRIYDLPDGEERERRFREFHATWFSLLGLGYPVVAALEEQTLLAGQIRLCCIVPARSAQEESADLYVPGNTSLEGREADRVIVIKLRPQTLLNACSLQALLRHELMHIADMLDPQFGYQAMLPKSEAGSAYDNLIRERYRVLWDMWIDGRLSRHDWVEGGIREKRLEEFMETFSLCGEEAEEKFRQVFDSSSQTHEALVARALNSDVKGTPSGSGKARTSPCPLCRFPSVRLLYDSDELPESALEEIAADFPNWRPEHGLCCQCADLYRARELSRAAEAALPRI